MSENEDIPVRIDENMVKDAMRQTLIELHYPDIRAADFLDEKYDGAIAGMLYDGKDVKINYDLMELTLLMDDYNDNRDPMDLIEDKDKVVTSTTLRDIETERKEAEDQTHQRIIEEMEKEADEEIASYKEASENSGDTGKTFFRDEE